MYCEFKNHVMHLALGVNSIVFVIDPNKEWVADFLAFISNPLFFIQCIYISLGCKK